MESQIDQSCKKLMESILEAEKTKGKFIGFANKTISLGGAVFVGDLDVKRVAKRTSLEDDIDTDLNEVILGGGQGND